VRDRFALAIPFLLPEMHERYFYLADVLSIIYAFYFPRYFYVAVIMQLCSLLSYAPYLMNTQVVNLAYVAFGVLVIIVITVVDLVLTLYPTIKTRLALVDALPKRE
jgi:Gpi18-like mannosyltransferase